MSEEHVPKQEDRASRPSERYVPPQLVYLGNVRDLLGKTGADADKPKKMKNPRRP